MSEENLDYQKAYLLSWLTFLGVTDIQTITVEKTLLGPDARSASLASGVAEAEALANTAAVAA
jgi:FMN-dependent NADH-azoreductase